MGEHRYNPVARANSVPKQMVQALDLGGAAALLGLQLMPVLDEAKENLVVLLCAIGGRKSDLIPTAPHPVVLMELAKVPLAGLVKVFEGGGGGGDTSSLPGLAGTSPPDASTEAATPSLLVVP